MMLGPVITEMKVDVRDIHQPVPVPVVVPVDPVIVVSDWERISLSALDSFHVAMESPVVLVVVVTVHGYRDGIVVLVVLSCRNVNRELVMTFLGVAQA